MKKLKVTVSTIVSVLLCGFLLPSIVFACPAGPLFGKEPPSPKLLYNSVATVFEGKVLPPGHDVTPGQNGRVSSVVVEVTKVWKGTTMNSTVLVSNNWICGDYWSESSFGKEYIFFTTTPNPEVITLSNTTHDYNAIAREKNGDSPYVRYLYPKLFLGIVPIKTAMYASIIVVLLTGLTLYMFHRRKILRLH